MNDSQVLVRHFRQIMLWPLQLMPIHPAAQIQKHCEHLDQTKGTHPWHLVIDEIYLGLSYDDNEPGPHSALARRHGGQ